MGGLTSPFPLLMQACKGGTLSHLAYWNLLHKILDVAAYHSNHIVPERFSGLPPTPLDPPVDLPGSPRAPPLDNLDPLDPPAPPQILDLPALTTEFGPRFMRQQGQRLRAFMLCTSFPEISWTRMRLPCLPLKLVLLTVLDLCFCLCLTRVSCCGHPSIH